MYVNNIEPEMFLPPGSESFNHNATRTTSSRSRSNNVNNNIVPVYNLYINAVCKTCMIICDPKLCCDAQCQDVGVSSKSCYFNFKLDLGLTI